MRFMYKAVLGMLLFNFFLITFAGLFNPETDYNPTDPTTDEDIMDYGNVANAGTIIKTFLEEPSTWIIMGVLTLSSIAAKYFMGGQINTIQVVGIGAFIGLITAIFNASIQVFTNIANSNTYIKATYEISMVIFGILILITVIEMMLGQQGVN